MYLHIRFYVRANAPFGWQSDILSTKIAGLTPLMVTNPAFFIYEDCGANTPYGCQSAILSTKIAVLTPLGFYLLSFDFLLYSKKGVSPAIFVANCNQWLLRGVALALIYLHIRFYVRANAPFGCQSDILSTKITGLRP